ncbi:23S rRNA pseudouridine synthase F [Endozoicomonas sp. OPT23]|uniref:pseudouridine synthase n=1 Tax=Endozoicomonas sp. OPT23 TaxID=2072845 RepID=UPI00129BA9AD|nr:pseudouridine synthase [Endozoicomonas sp. OPT23]MRI34599.1 23S rRNA pseudouridine synthase F [Endozoicomonas sp. OPT23]
MTTRLAKYIAEAGYCSRRGASRLIDADRVTVNNRPANHIDHVTDQDQIHIDGELLNIDAERVYWLYNKPVGIDCVCKTDDKSSIIHKLPTSPRAFPVGRLDKDSHGLLLLTNDGELCHRLIHPDFFHEKEYQVTVDKPVTPTFIETMVTGVQYRDVKTRPCKVEQTATNTFFITLTEGKNRQIRRMCKALGYMVVDLQRLRILNLLLSDLGTDQIRPLTTSEQSILLSSLQLP